MVSAANIKVFRRDRACPCPAIAAGVYHDMETVGCEENVLGQPQGFALRRRIGSAQAFHVSVGAHPRVRPGKETVIS